MRLGVISDIHGNAVALRAVLDDARAAGVDRWLVLGDLVLFGPQPAEVFELLADLPDATFLRGNTDRYVLTDEQPAPHSTPADAAGDADLVRRYGLLAAASAWTRGVLDQAGVLGFLDTLATSHRTTLADGASLLAVHASPFADDGPGIDTRTPEDELATLVAGADATWIVGGHTHDPTDRRVGTVRALNPGSVGLPRTLGRASWLLLDSTTTGTTVEHRSVPFAVDAVIEALDRRRHPNREFVASVLARGTFTEHDRGVARESCGGRVAPTLGLGVAGRRQDAGPDLRLRPRPSVGGDASAVDRNPTGSHSACSALHYRAIAGGHDLSDTVDDVRPNGGHLDVASSKVAGEFIGWNGPLSRGPAGEHQG